MSEEKIVLRLLGSTELRRDGDDLGAVLAGSKRVGVLAYLVLARPRGFQRRDKLLPLFWPERGQKSARNALSNMLYQLRHALGADVIVNRGAEEIRVRHDRLSCDVLAFEEALDQGEEEQALNLYRGALLSGFYVSGAAPAFDQWLNQERDRLRLRAAEAAWTLAEEAEACGNGSAARRWARKGAELMPFSEEAHRRLIALLQRLGDRASALEAYEAFAERLRKEWEIEPTDELKALIEDLDASDDPREGSPPESLPRASPLGEESSSRGENVSSETSGEETALDDGGHLGSPRSRGKPFTPWLRRGWVWGGVATLLALVIAIAWIPRNGEPGQPTSPSATASRPVAVLPFTYLNAKDSTDYFSLGITEEITTRLGKVSGLSVISWTSVMRYRDTEKNLDQIGEELGLRAIVEGSIQRAGSQIRVNAQLVEVQTDRQLWSASYSRELRNILELQSEVATRIAEALQTKLRPQERAQLAAQREVDAAAYHLYLHAQHLRDRRDPAEMSRAAALFREAIDRDSTFAPAYGELAMTSVWLGIISGMDTEITGTEGLPRDTAGARALRVASRALTLDSSLVEAHLARALVYERFQREWERSEHAFQQALRLNPSHSEARREYGWHLLRLGKVDRALVQMRRAVEVDPLLWDAHHSLGYAYHTNRQYGEAVQELETALELGGRDPITEKFLIVALLKRSQRLFLEERDKEATTHLTRADALMEGIWGRDQERRVIFKLALRGRQTEAIDRLAKNPRPVFYALALTGQKKRVLEHVKRTTILDFRVYADPIFDAVRDDPRFERIVERKLRHDVGSS